MNGKYKISIGIDFGTSGVTLGFALDGNVFIHSNWKGQTKTSKIEKHKTKILLDDKKELIAFGVAAYEGYITNVDSDDQQHEWRLFENFKLSLFENKDEEKNLNNSNLLSVNGQSLPTETVFVATLMYLKKLSQEYITKVLKMQGVGPNDVQYLIAVPSTWDDKAKDNMRQWACKAGLCKDITGDQLRILYESECACLSVTPEIDNQLQTEDKYMLIDLGGGSTQISYYEVARDQEIHVKEMVSPTRIPWGSLNVNKRFESLLNDIFSENWMKSFKKDHPQMFVFLMENFQQAKESFYSDEYHKSGVNVRLPKDFCDFLSKQLTELYYEDNNDSVNNMVIEENIRNNKITDLKKFSKKISVYDDQLQIDTEVWKSYLFDPVIDKISQHIKDSIGLNQIDLNFIVMVGGFSQSKYLEEKLKGAFSEVPVYKPQRPTLSVVDGAARFGLSNNYTKFVTQRFLKKSYGTRVWFPLEDAQNANVPRAHINKYKVEDHGETLVDMIFDPFLKSGLIRNNSEIYKHETQRNNEAAMTNELTIYGCESNNQIIIDNNKCKQIGIIKSVELPKNVKDLNVTMELDFRFPVIYAYIYPSSSPQLKKDLMIQYS